MNTDPPIPHQSYPTIPARIKAGEIDALIIIGFLILLVGLYLAIDRETPVIVFLCIAVLLLYEPVLVTWRGQTIGHRIMGFRIIDSATGANISFSKSLTRLVLKAALGIVSLFWAFFERRQQFLHDSITQSMAVMCDVRADDIALRASMSEMPIRPGDATASTPSLKRRVVVILLYALAAFVLISVIVALIFPDCAADKPMSAEQCHIVESITGGLLLVLWLSTVTIGLRGGLPGARKPDGTH